MVAAGCGRDGETESTDTTTTASTTTTVASDDGAGDDAATTTSAPDAPTTPEGYAPTADDIADACASEPLEATETGVSESTITVEVMADTGSPLAPGIFQGNVDAIVAFADHVNANGGIGCRMLEVRTWDSKFDPTEVKNGQIDACENALALLGGNSAFNPDPSAMESCVDATGAATGLPNVAAFAVDTNEMCSPMTIGVNTRSEQCPVAVDQNRDIERVVGHARVLEEMYPGLHGVYVANGDLPSTKASAVSDVAAIETVGIEWDGTIVQSSSDDQAAFIPRVEFLKQGANFVYNGSADFVTTLFMKEAIAQGVDVDEIVWSCGVACYTQTMLSSGGDAVEGSYVWIQFLPLEETDTNPALDAYVSTVGADKVDTWGAVSWQAAIAFQHAVNQIVLDDGPNAITRAALLDALGSLEDFTADGISGPRALGELSDCFVLLQVQDGAFVRAWPEERGTFDCDPTNLATVNVNPEQGAAELGQ